MIPFNRDQRLTEHPRPYRFTSGWDERKILHWTVNPPAGASPTGSVSIQLLCVLTPGIVLTVV